MTTSIHRSQFPVIIYITSIALCVYCYWPGLWGYFVVDDHWNIALNPRVWIETLDIESIVRSALSGESGPLKRPIAMLSFGLNYYFTGLEEFWMKSTNLVIHISSGCVLLLVMLRVFKILSVRYTRYENQLIPYIITSVWLIHPINVTAVSYIVQRMTSLAGLFILLVLLFYLKLRTDALSTIKGYVFTVLIVLFWLFGIFTKEIAALTGLLVIVLEYFLFNFNTANKKDKLHLQFVLCFLCVPILIGLIYILFNYQKYFIDSYALYRDFTVWERLITQARVIVYYVTLMILPDISQLGVYQDGFQVSKSVYEPWNTSLCIILILCSLYTGWKIRKKYPLASIGIAWFYSMHLMESTVISLELVFLHRNYIPSIGIILVFAELVIMLAKRNMRLASASVAIFFLIFSFSTRSVAWFWSNDYYQILIDASNYPNSPRANSAAGMYYFNAALVFSEGDLKDQFFADSFKYLERSYELDKDVGVYNYFWVLSKAAESNHKIPSIIIENIMEKAPGNKVKFELLPTLDRMKDCLMKDGCTLSKNDFVQILGVVKHMQPMKPDFESYYYNVYASFLFEVEMDYERAIGMQKKAIEIIPSLPENYINLFIFYKRIPDIKKMNETRNRLIDVDKFGLFSKKVNEFEKDIKDAMNFMDNIEYHRSQYKGADESVGLEKDEL